MASGGCLSVEVLLEAKIGVGAKACFFFLFGGVLFAWKERVKAYLIPGIETISHHYCRRPLLLSVVAVDHRCYLCYPFSSMKGKLPTTEQGNRGPPYTASPEGTRADMVLRREYVSVTGVFPQTAPRSIVCACLGGTISEASPGCKPTQGGLGNTRAASVSDLLGASECIAVPGLRWRSPVLEVFVRRQSARMRWTASFSSISGTSLGFYLWGVVPGGR